MTARTLIGLDIGSTLTKIVYGEPHAIEFDLDIGREDGPYTEAHAEEHIQAMLEKTGGPVVGVTGVGTDTFLNVAQKYPALRAYAGSGDPITREVTNVALGARSLFRRQQGLMAGPKGTFLSISIGTGVSYALVDPTNRIQVFDLGLPIGGGFQLGQNGGDASSLEDAPLDEQHGDLLIKERLPALEGTLQGEFVLACYGNMGRPGATKRMTDAKCVATMIIRDVLILNRIPGWASEGPVVITGTPVDTFPQLKMWLQLYFAAIGREALIPENSGYAGALGAYQTAETRSDLSSHQ